MSVMIRLGLIAAFAAASMGCDQATDAGSKQSITVKLRPPRPYKPEPAFSMATGVPVRKDQPVEVPSAPRS